MKQFNQIFHILSIIKVDFQKPFLLKVYSIEIKLLQEFIIIDNFKFRFDLLRVSLKIN